MLSITIMFTISDQLIRFGLRWWHHGDRQKRLHEFSCTKATGEAAPPLSCPTGQGSASASMTTNASDDAGRDSAHRTPRIGGGSRHKWLWLDRQWALITMRRQMPSGRSWAGGGDGRGAPSPDGCFLWIPFSRAVSTRRRRMHVSCALEERKGAISKRLMRPFCHCVYPSDCSASCVLSSPQ